MYQNLHTHSFYSDGSDSPEKYIEQARLAGMPGLGFSDHSPLPFPNTFALKDEMVEEYCLKINELKSSSNGFNVFLGMEVDYIPGIGYSFDHFRKRCSPDYLIGSVHLIKSAGHEELWFIDGPDPATYDNGLQRFFGGDIRQAVTAYFGQIREMLETSRCEIIGHFDKIKMHNRGRYFSEDEPWYQAQVDETLELVRQKGVIIEINTRGIYKKRSDTTFPGPAILRKMRKLKIPVIISSDAHKPDEVAMLFAEAAEMLRVAGYEEVAELDKGGWKTVPLRDQ